MVVVHDGRGEREMPADGTAHFILIWWTTWESGTHCSRGSWFLTRAASGCRVVQTTPMNCSPPRRTWHLSNKTRPEIR